MITDYVERIAENELQKNLDSSGCVLVKGPKFCGKSTMCEKYAKSVTALKTNNAIALAKSDPKSALLGERPHLIDEWQKAPEIWNLIKDDLDKDYQFGKFIITGSTTPVSPSKIQNSAAGRIAPMTLRPFTLFESKESDGLISLEGLFNPEYPFVTEYENPISLADIAFYVCRGGWPIATKAKKESAIRVTTNYYAGLFTIEEESDEFSEFLRNKNIDLLTLVLKAYARNISTQAKNTRMIADILASGERSVLDEATFLAYKKTLEDLFVIYDMPAWNLNLRSTISVRVAPTHHFYDTSIATACLGIIPADLLNDLNSFGFFFEDLAVRDLTVYAGSFDGKVKHYRDSSGQEVDAVVLLPNGSYGAIEIKIASEENIQEGIASLNRFERKMQGSQLKTPAFKMVLTSHGSCYRSEDGTFVVPINRLRP